MTLEKIKRLTDKIYPKIEEHYGMSKFQECTPWVEFEHSIYARLMGEPEVEPEDGEQNPDAEYDSMDNSIILYFPKIKSKKELIECLIHEYQHYLQSPSWMKRYYDMGYHYWNHPYEVAALEAEKDWKLFN